MNNLKSNNTTSKIVSLGASQRLKDLGILVKFRLNITVVFSAIMAYLIASDGVALQEVLLLALGGFLITGAANGINQVLEKDFDLQMNRTSNRPVAAGRMSVSTAVLASGFMSLGGIVCLALFNPLTAFLGMISFLLYAFVYTPLKRITPTSVIIGAIPGALPMMIGVVALSGGMTALALVLFGIQFFWQMPHFWAIAWLGSEDYNKAGFKIIPTADGKKDGTLGLQAFFYALMLLPLSWATYFIGINSIVTGILLSLAAIVYAYFGWILYKKNDRKSARNLMFSSFFYLPFVLFVMLIDKI